MKLSIINYSELPVYGDSHFILSPDFYMQAKLNYVYKLKNGKKIFELFQLKNNTISKIKEKSICYDLTHSLGKFFNKGNIVHQIDSVKKFAYPGDFLISRMRSYLEEMAIVEPKDLPQVFSTEYLVYSELNPKIFSSLSLLPFCMTEHVQTILQHSQYGTEHPRFYEFVLSNLSIPKPVLQLNQILSYLVRRSLELRSDSVEEFLNSETILLSELGLLHWIPKHALAFIKNYSNVRDSNRMDAKYFQPKYDEIVETIKRYKGGWDILENLVSMKSEQFDPLPEAKYRYIELSNIGSSGEITGCTDSIGKYLPARAKRKIATNDLIASSIEGSLDSISLITEEYDSCVCSTGFHVLLSQNIQPACLFIFMKSILGQLLLKKGCTGTILTAIGEDELLKIPLPLIEQEIQEQIEEKISSVANLRRRSRALLEVAKRGIEIAIEQDQEAAMAWMNAHVEELE